MRGDVERLIVVTKLDRALGRFDRECRRPELHVTDDLAVHHANAEAVVRIAEFRRPRVGGELGEECGEVLRAVEMGERVAEAPSEDVVDGRKVGGGSIPMVHWSPAGAGHRRE